MSWGRLAAGAASFGEQLQVRASSVYFSFHGPSTSSVSFSYLLIIHVGEVLLLRSLQLLWFG
jgi:hypothetical protein